MDTAHSYKNYRVLLQQATPPTVPYMKLTNPRRPPHRSAGSLSAFPACTNVRSWRTTPLKRDFV
ncbi:hypothetical protein ANCDUO_20309 [Ancylostoma duodenale]|uniref:Uncharacterized protein n=1 Tax=Ancylostoma duodenale TaxID=51022 RepID=A0A0C2CIJ9_9BILA|nr:hypothetical protein ANCDUO_20309 [Ancylostoma duodenale]